MAAARDLRDRYLDEVNSGRVLLEGASKYDVSRQLAPTAAAEPIEPVVDSIPLLNAA